MEILRVEGGQMRLGARWEADVRWEKLQQRLSELSIEFISDFQLLCISEMLLASMKEL